jgi:hypothetical protein
MTSPGSRVEYVTHPVANGADAAQTYRLSCGHLTF